MVPAGDCRVSIQSELLSYFGASYTAFEKPIGPRWESFYLLAPGAWRQYFFLAGPRCEEQTFGKPALSAL